MGDELKYKYTMVLATEASGTGAQKTVDDLQRVQTAMGDTAGKARVSEFAFYDLDAAMKKGANTSDTFTAGATKVQKSTGNAAQSLLLFSQGFEDAQYGMRGVLNNIPGLIVSLGGGAGLAGAISIAAVGFSILYEWLGKTEEKSTTLKDSLGEIADNMGQLQTDELDKAREKVNQAFDDVEKLRAKFGETQQADNESTTAALSNAEKLATARRLINELLGIEINKLDEIRDKSAADDAKREEQLRQDIAAQQKRLTDIQTRVSDKSDHLEGLRSEKELTDKIYEKRVAELLILQKQRDELQKLANAPTPNFHKVGQGNDLQAEVAFDQSKRDANETLGSGLIQTQIAGLQKKLDAVRLHQESGDKAIQQAEVALTDLNNTAIDVQGAVEKKTEELKNTFKADTSVAKLTEVGASQKAFADQLTEVVNQLQPTLATGIAAKDSILQATSDHKLTLDELQALSKNLVTLVGQMQSGMVLVNGNQQTIIGILKGFETEQNRQKAVLSQFQGN